MTRRALGSQLSVVALSLAVAALGEGVMVTLVGWPDGAFEAAHLGVLSLGLWAGPALVVSLVLACLLAALLDDDTLGGWLREQWRTPGRRELLEVTLLADAAFVAFVFVVVRATSRFRNVELTALLVTLLMLGGLGLVGATSYAIWRVRRRSAHGWRWFLPLALGADLLVTLWLGYQARSGLSQLDARLLGAPLAFVTVLLLADGSERVRGWGLRAACVGVAVTVLCWASFLLAGPGAASLLMARGAWSPALIELLRAASDVDRDGYSSLLGGQDCAPFDAAVNPGAREVLGDGIDNNCIGGDAGKTWQPRRPNWGSQAHGAPMNLNVVVVTIETLRHDHASFLGAKHDTTPELKALAREALVFERMYSAAPLTRLSIASLFSSYAPSEIEWLPQPREKRMRRIGPSTPWLPELLSARGYDTIAVLTDFSAFTPLEDAGFERGFHHYDLSTKLQYRGGTMWGFPASEQVDKAIALVRAAKRPVFLWLHLFEPHYMYEQPPDAPHFGDDEQSRYDAEIWQVDHELGRLVRALRELGAWDDTVMFVSGDHGEAFGEHADRWHGSNLHDPQLRPAALLRVPGVVGKRIKEPVTFTDVAPTLARVLGDRQLFERLRGRSLTPFLHRGKLPEGSNGFFAESFSVEDGHAYQAAFIDYPLKLIYVEEGRLFSLFDLKADPAELVPLDPATDARGAPLLRELVGYLEKARPESLTAPR